MGNLALADLNSLWVGFDRLHNEISRGFGQVEYPRFNLIRSNDTEYTIEVSLAGWDKKDIEVIYSKKDGKITVKGTKQVKDNVSYLHKGISGKSFNKSFHLAEHVVVESAEFNSGLLVIILKLVLPEELKPVTIDIK
jgi:molecular chaperone IbpA